MPMSNTKLNTYENFKIYTHLFVIELITWMYDTSIKNQ